ncbi:thioesterase superfamily protein [Staphylococcus aureus]|uniref:Thioesterase superfamily protein n=1 Tax=Staphylococcus aureus TaxID=1280 RepID=A0A8G2I163_STAAU|nr:PaaI family thioesterase [Staphylococcus aureus]EFB49982.1 4-hydroxybenzoyl-CoA thioesterase domain-containing protein [Staphylococcus aureus subsp. aureus D139]EFC07246.1 4-hydroxybenzoyl-CoA thioesterase domain-containing protein [Staphylococcus aureus subsp. aureus H19]MBO8530195.1 PaaI family thioesterase [Staphylococcus aureus]MBZ5402838.1 PaaI family thioesterase [Staphylococcus aureus]MBZ5420794.1 PaaI family thioesterase [Staphylococcus aureus]
MTHLLETFEMSIDHQEDGLVVISMPVTDKVKQPFGYLHGGASISLGETACSLGSANLIDTTKFIPLGLEMNANHIHSAKDGRVTATAEIIHQGKSTHVWDIKIKNDKEQLITVMRGTVAIKPLK